MTAHNAIYSAQAVIKRYPAETPDELMESPVGHCPGGGIRSINQCVR